MDRSIYKLQVNLMVKRMEKLLRLPEIVKNYPDCFFAYLKALAFGKNFLTLYKLTDGTRLWVNARGPDRGLLVQIWLYKVYTRFFDIEKNDVVVDIGSHIGVFTIYAARKAREVIAFEPIKNNFEILNANIKVNGLKNVITRRMAVWNVRKKLDIFLHHNSSANSIFNKTEKTERVQCITMADILEKLNCVDFMKIDSEGCELDTVISTPRNVIRKIKKFAIECGDRAIRKRIASYLQKCGYKTMHNDQPGYWHILFAVRR